MDNYPTYTETPYKKGYEKHPEESHTINAPENNLPHLKWKDWSQGKKKRAAQDIYFMSKKRYKMDEDAYPIAWRFNALDCLLSEIDKKRIVLFESLESQRLWDTFIPVKNLMELDNNAFMLHEKVALDFECESEPLEFFVERLSFPDFIWFFWGRSSAGIVPREVFLKSWSDFFYPSDENSILLIPKSSRVIFSFDDMFFYGDLLKN